jgi:hypothetical protein
MVRISVAAVVVAAAATVAGPTAPASAAPTGIQTVSEIAQGVPGAVKTAAVSCPDGLALINSGIDQGTLIGNGLGRRGEIPDTAIVRGRIGPLQQFTAYATCAVPDWQPDPALPIRVAAVGGPPGAKSKFGTANCPDGFRPLTGNGVWKDSRESVQAMWVNSITADGQGWMAAAQNDDRNARFTVEVYCVPRTAATVVATATVPADGGLSAVAVCPASYTVVTGGASLLRPDDTPVLLSSSITRSMAGEGGWQAIGLSFEANAKVVSRALCSL